MRSAAGNWGIRQANPGVLLPALKHGFDDFHVVDGIGQWCGHGYIIQDREREAVRLNRVLIANLEPDFLSVISELVPQPAGLIGWRIERNLDLDTARCTENVDALVIGKLRRTWPARARWRFGS